MYDLTIASLEGSSWSGAFRPRFTTLLVRRRHASDITLLTAGALLSHPIRAVLPVLLTSNV
jgi:hypothetical protein